MIIPLAQCHPHEQVLPGRVDRIAADIVRKGAIEDPLLVTRFPNTSDQWLVIDGMHRFAACQKLGLRSVAVHEIDYNDPHITVGTWDIVTRTAFHAEKNAPAGYRVQEYPWTQASALQTQVRCREILAAIADRGHHWIAIGASSDGRNVQTVMQVIDAIDQMIDQQQLDPEFVADDQSIQQFENGSGASLILRPCFTKSEVMSQSLQGHIFPYKSTRHIIPNRPRHLNVPLTQLQ